MGLSFGLQQPLLIRCTKSQLIEHFERLIQILRAIPHRPEQHDIAVQVW